MELKRAKALKYQLLIHLRALKVLQKLIHRSTRVKMLHMKLLKISQRRRIQARWTKRVAKVQSLIIKTMGMSKMKEVPIKSTETNNLELQPLILLILLRKLKITQRVAKPYKLKTLIKRTRKILKIIVTKHHKKMFAIFQRAFTIQSACTTHGWVFITSGFKSLRGSSASRAEINKNLL